MRQIQPYDTYSLSDTGEKIKLSAYTLLLERAGTADLVVELVPEINTFRQVMVHGTGDPLVIHPVAANAVCLRTPARPRPARGKRAPAHPNIRAITSGGRARSLTATAVVIDLERRLQLIVDVAPVGPWKGDVMLRTLGGPIAINFHSADHIYFSCDALYRWPDRLIDAEERYNRRHGPHARL